MGIRKATAVKLLFVLTWIVLFGMLLHRHYFIRTIDVREIRALEKGRREHFAGIFFRGDRIGYVRTQTTTGETGTLLLAQDAVLNLNVLERRYPVRLHIDASMGSEGFLREFSFSLNSPFSEMHAEGRVEDRDVVFSLLNGKEKLVHRIRLAEPPRLFGGDRRVESASGVGDI